MRRLEGGTSQTRKTLDEMPRRVKRSNARHHGGRIQEYFLFNVTQNIIVKGYILKSGGISQ